MYGFYLCKNYCDVKNWIDRFPEASPQIFFEWQFSNFPANADYERIWSRDGEEWVHFRCAWPGPEAGTHRIMIAEPDGFASGTWQLTILMDGEILMQKEVLIEGDYEFWTPAGNRTNCYVP